MKLSNLTHDAGHPLSRHKFGAASASCLFVETVISSGILSENGANRLNGMVNAAIGQLQNFMTPGASTDLETMLWFVSGNNGGLSKVKEAVTKAGTLTTPVYQDQNWWQELFTIFNLKDPAIQQQIQTQTVRGAGQPPGSTAPVQQAPVQQAPVQQAPAQQARQPIDPALMAQLQAQGQAVQGNQTELQDMLAKNTAAREASMARIRELQTKIDALRAKRAGKVTEDMFNALAATLLNEADVKSNLKFVASNLMRRLGYASTTPVQEVNWLKKFVGGFQQPRTMEESGFRDFFSNLRTMIANPNHAKMQHQNSELKNYNERSAKLAVKYMTDWLTSEVNNRLQVANLTRQDMATSLAEWKNLHAAATRYAANKTTPPPDFTVKFNAARQKVLRLAYALNPSLANGSTL